jgi:glucokinase
VVSGQGIAAIYEFLRLRGVARESPKLAAAFETWKREIARERPTVDLAAEVSRAAIADEEPLCAETMEVFVGAYGAEAGNLALKLLPYGGLFVAGGIAAKILPLLDRGGFIAAFKDKGRMAPLLERVPVHVVLDSKVGLIGAARHAAELLDA